MIEIFLLLFLPRVIFNIDNSPEVTAANQETWTKVNTDALEPIITAKSAVVIDADTEEILYQKNKDEPRSIASISKLLTAYLYLRATDRDITSQIRLLPADERPAGQRYIYRGESATALDYLNAMLIGSDNSAAVALTRAAGLGADFPTRAQQALTDLKLDHTALVEPTGLSKQNVSTAHDIARLAKLVWQDEQIETIAGTAKYTFHPAGSTRTRGVATTDQLLGTTLFKIKAGKTGYTSDADYCLVIKVASTDHPDIIVAVLGSATEADRFQDGKALAWWVLKNYAKIRATNN